MGDQAILILVHVFHRIFDGNDVAVTILVAVVDHGGEGSGFTGAGGAYQNDQAALAHDHVLEHRGQADLVELRDVSGNGAQHHARMILLHKYIHAETPYAFRADGEIAFLLQFEFGLLLIIHDGVGERLGVYRREPLTCDWGHFAVDLHGRWKIIGNKQIRCLFA